MKLRLLILDEEFPYPLNSGKRLRSFNLTRELSQEHDVTYLAYGEHESEGARGLREAGIATEAVRAPDRKQFGVRFYWRLLKNVFQSDPYIVASHYTRRMQRRLRELVDSGNYDLVMVEWSPYARFIRHCPGAKKVIVAHNIESSIWRRYEQNERSLLRRLYVRLQRSKVEKFERDCFQWADGAIAVSPAEAKTISDMGVPYRTAVVDNGVDTAFFRPADVGKDEQLVFTGAMDWRPNQDAAEFFIDEILPEIRKLRPDAHFTLVGRKPPRHIKELGSAPGVTVTGTVDDVRPYIRDAAVFVVPLRIGGGSRLKILEALAMKKAVVSTPVGAEGLDVNEGKDILLADSPQDFAATVVRCMNDANLRRRLGNNGRKLVEERYQWEKLAEKLNQYLTSILRAQ